MSLRCASNWVAMGNEIRLIKAMRSDCDGVRELRCGNFRLPHAAGLKNLGTFPPKSLEKVDHDPSAGH